MFVPGKLFQPNLIFVVGEARSRPLSGAPERYCIWVDIRLGWKSLRETITLAYYDNYDLKKSYDTGTCMGVQKIRAHMLRTSHEHLMNFS